MKHLKLLGRLFLGVFILIAWACDNDDDGPNDPDTQQNIVEVAQDTDALSTLVAALIKADENDGTDLVAALSADGEFTVFAPTNDAFAALLAQLDGYDSLDDFDSEADRDLLASILTYHVVAGGTVSSGDLADGQSYTTLQGESIGINLNGGVFINDATDTDAQVVIADVMASNGIVHVIDKVLLPQAVIDAINASEEQQNIVEIAQATADLSLLVDALVQADADLVATLSSAGPFTVFAPTNDAFAALLEELGPDYNSLEDFDTMEEKELLAAILTYHVVAGAAVMSGDLTDGQTIATVQGGELTVSINGGTVQIIDASGAASTVVIADVEASNGVVHVIDRVLLPQEAVDAFAKPTIVETAQATADLSILVDALVQADAGLVETLNGEGPFTVFAPTNAAFAALLDALGPDYNSIEDFDTADEKALLATILTYHVVGAAAFSSDLSDGQMITTVQGEMVEISLDGGVFVIDAAGEAAAVTTADVEASNGVVHIIDRVLLPQEAIDALAP